MTGFGQASFSDDEMSADVTVHSVNGKHLKTKVTLRADMPVVVERIRSLVPKYMTRGTVDVSLRLDWAGAGQAAFNDRAFASYAEQLGKLSKKLGLSAEIHPDRVAMLPGAMEVGSVSNRAANHVWRKIRPAVTAALEKAVRMKTSEGKALTTALRQCCTRTRKLLRRIEARVPKTGEERRKRLTQRVSALMEKAGETLEPGSVAREIIMLSERSDISEETCRMKAPLAHCTAALAEERAGRKLEFIGQEMDREANTMVSKAADTTMTNLIIDLRGEVDKIREQVLNLE